MNTWGCLGAEGEGPVWTGDLRELVEESHRCLQGRRDSRESAAQLQPLPGQGPAGGAGGPQRS